MISFVFLMLFRVRPQDLFHQAVSDHIFFIQFDMADAVNILQDAHGGGQTTALIARQIHLGHIPGYDSFGTGSDTGEKHF